MRKELGIQENKLTTALELGLASLRQTFPNNFSAKLLQYIQLLQKWNQVYNLTAIRDPLEMVSKHILDSLSIAPYVTGQRIIDVGTGAGFPGIPLALAFPEKEFVLLDSNAKKTRFLQQAVQELGLCNVRVVTSRVEAYKEAQSFDHVVTRAFASLQQIWLSTHHLCVHNGNVLAMKGACLPEEINELTAVQIKVTPLKVPGLIAARQLIIMQDNSLL